MQCVCYLLLITIVHEAVATTLAGHGENFASDSESSQLNDNLSCPPWSFFNGTDCECGDDLNGLVYCNQQTQVSSLLNCYCMTYDNTTGETVVGASLYCCFNHSYVKSSESSYRPFQVNTFELNEEMCQQFNRRGRLCGQCKEGSFSPAYHYDIHCKNCTYSRYNWVKYTALAFGPLTVFFLIVIAFSISPTNPPTLAAFVLVCQAMSSPQVLRVLLAATDSVNYAHTLISILATFYGIWNLDFFRTLVSPICLQLPTLQTLALDYAIAFYPLLLIVVAYILIEFHARGCKLFVWAWRPFDKYFSQFRRRCNFKTSIIDAFATFLLLSYIKLLSVSCDLLLPTTVYNVHGEKLETSYLYYDATVEFFSSEHLPYAILAMLVFLIFTILPVLLMLLYPCQCFQRCLTHFRVRSLALKIFMDAFQGYYKDGTAGTRDCRFFAAIVLASRVLLFIMYAFTVNLYFWALTGIMFTMFGSTFIIFQPYKSSVYNVIDSIMYLFIALWSFSFIILQIANLAAPKQIHFSVIIMAVLSTVPFLYIAGVFFHWLCCKKKILKKILHKLHIMHHTRIDRSPTLPDRLVNPEIYDRVLADPVEELDDSGSRSDIENTAY